MPRDLQPPLSQGQFPSERVSNLSEGHVGLEHH